MAKTKTQNKKVIKKSTAKPKTTKRVIKKAASKSPKTIKKVVAKTTSKKVVKKSTRAKKALVKKRTTAKKTATKRKAMNLSKIEPKLVAQVPSISNPIHFLLRLDVLIAISLFFLLITNIISFSLIQNDIATLQDDVMQLQMLNR